MITFRRPTAALTVALLLAACGGGSAATSGPGGTTAATDTPASQAASDAPGATPTEGAVATPAESSASGGSVFSGEACDLLTPADVDTTLGVTGTTVGMSTPGDVSFCIYQAADGSSNVATSLMKQGGTGAFAIWKSGAGVQDVDGVGDDAVFDPSSSALVVLKGDAVLSVTAGDGSDDEAQRLAWSKALAQIAVEQL